MIQTHAPCGTPCGAGIALASLGFLPSSGAWLPAGPAGQPDCGEDTTLKMPVFGGYAWEGDGND